MATRHSNSEPSTTSSDSTLQEVDTKLLRSWPLPDPNTAADKDERGRVMIVGGCTQMPGAIILAALGAMRAGAGKIVLVTAERVAPMVALAVPEARVIGVDETSEGGLLVSSLDSLPRDVDALLIGPGMQDEATSVHLTQTLIEHCKDATVVLDAIAMSAVTSPRSDANKSNVIITPHPGEMAHLTGKTKEQIQDDLRAAATEGASRWSVTIAMKSATTFIASPDGKGWRHGDGNVGLATSGSGDVLAGIIAGLCARGAPCDQATVWGVALHARSGAMLAEQFGSVGYLAREIPLHIPGLMDELSGIGAPT